MARNDPALPPVEVRERGTGSDPGPPEPAEAPAHAGEPTRGASWSWHVAALGIAMIVAGAWLAASPFLLDYLSDAAAINAIACGCVTTFLGVLRFGGVRHPAVGYVTMALGAWLFASGFLLGELGREVWNARSTGAIVFFCGFVGLARATPDPSSERPTADLR